MSEEKKTPTPEEIIREKKGLTDIPEVPKNDAGLNVPTSIVFNLHGVRIEVFDIELIRDIVSVGTEILVSQSKK
ncbi:MAG: hypothetical protein KAT16_09980 [Candidatus Heimdallarchaeota archaeon]|nr:hypothetical protein [Candidatus Heimdallarchaeota archaeon]